MSAPRRGLFGGTFDPPHVAHVALAHAALDTLELEAVHWVPVGDPWQKARAITPATDREAMVRLAIGSEPRFLVDRIELERVGPSYTIDTVRALQAEHPGVDWFLIIGADQYAGLHTWREWPELLRRVTIAVAERPGATGAAGAADAAVRKYPHRRVPMPLLDVAATEIRERVAHGLPIDHMVPPAVARYIDQHGLYRRSPNDQNPTLAKLAAPQGRGPGVPGGRAPLMDIRKLQRAIVDGLEDVKAQDVRVFNTEHLSPLFERVIVASGTSNRQTKALAASVRETVKARGMAVMRTEGEDNGEWIIVDCGAAVAHIMQPAIRQYYNLEEIWGEKAVKLKSAVAPKGLVKAAEPTPASGRASSRPAPTKAAAKKSAPKKSAPKQAAPRKSTSKASAPRQAAAHPAKAPAKRTARHAAPAKKAPARKSAPPRTARPKA